MAVFAASSSAVSAIAGSDKLGTVLPTRIMGRTGQRITAFTLGGAHVTRAETELMSQKVIETAIELGCRSFDNAQKYGDGRSEILYGKYLTPKYRDHVFITTKTHGRTRQDVRKELETSLHSMKLDYLDLWQIHSVRSVEDAEIIWENGVVEEFMKARDEGLVRYIGFTGHRSYKGHLRLLELLKKGGLQMDTCLMPMNLVDPHYDSFIVNVLPELIEQGYGVLAMKTMAHGNLVGVDTYGKPIPREERNETLTDVDITKKDLHHYIYSLPVTSLISGCLFDREVRENIGNLTNFTGMDAEERDALLARSAPFQGKEKEYYKA
jgi:aryl-alcohol dehydrogenase-like predicted oxidoreductase